MSIELVNVHKYYNRDMANEVHAVADVSLYIKDAEVACLQGPSGSGKSTLLSIIGCFFPPTSGRVMIAGKKLSRLPDFFLTQYRREKIGFIFQRYNLIESLSVLENVTLPLLPLGVRPKERNRRGRRLLERLGIDGRKHFLVERISGGEMQRVAIARALICDPPIILADEPTAHLDTSLSRQFMEIMALLKQEGKTIILTSHDPLITSHPLVDSLYTIEDGRLRDEVHS